MSRISWTDLNKDGKRIEALIKQMNTKFYTTEDSSLRLAYFDRIMKATNTKHELVKTVLGVREILKKAKERQSQEGPVE